MLTDDALHNGLFATPKRLYAAERYLSTILSVRCGASLNS
jgi:hypothetical protein